MLALFVITLSSCIKSSDDGSGAINTGGGNSGAAVKAQAILDSITIKNYITAHKLDSVQEGPSGLYYKIITPGKGLYPILSSTVTVNYEGSLATGTIFAPKSSIVGVLSDFIPGWQLGIPNINAGGTILLLIPSALGYGKASPSVSIPANSVLVFTVQLVSYY